MSDRVKFLWIAAFFLVFYFIPADNERVLNALAESVAMMHDYAREHVLLCLVPAFFIAGAVSVFVSRQSVMRYLGGRANRWLAYSVASVSGGVLAVCSCTVLPLFAGIYSRGAGLGPASTFLYSGPAINILAIVLTARVLGFELGVARAVGAIVISLLIGLIMGALFGREEGARQEGFATVPEPGDERPWRTVAHIGGMVLFLLFANWAPPRTPGGLWSGIYEIKWLLSGLSLSLVIFASRAWFSRDERKEWVASSRDYALLITPLLFAGVLGAGFLLGRPGHEALIPARYVAMLVGGNSFGANFFASLSGAFMYFATLTEVPILDGLIGAGMGRGPALALLLAGPALSLPSMLVISGVLGPKKTLAFISLVVLLSATAGVVFGHLFN
ncbi:MAG: permease [Synergistota bacterium]|nr:permease [Synergistota bacterium]